jgi:ABC-type transporter Mla MlaB component
VSNQQTVWVCPARLDAWAMQSLRSSLIPTAQPWQIDWSRLSELTADAASDLAELFSQWCMQPVKLQFAGADVLERVLRTLTPSGDRRTDMTWWRLRLDAMRVLRLQDEFELAALDFCVTFEVSPPAWTDPRCDCIAAGAAGQFQVSGPDLRLDTPTSGAAGFYSQATVPMSLDTLPAAMVELTGEVMGDASDVLEKFQAGMNGADRLVVSCTKLIRVDFSAAGSILNWAAACESKGCRVKFHDVPRLIAAFFSVIGINEHAIVSLRTN